jgi:glycosyltransferase involved in cell wall biosynthesis
MAALGHEVHVIASDVEGEFLRFDNVRWHPVRVPRWLPSAFFQTLWFALRAWLLLRWLPEYDVLQLNGAIVLGHRSDVNVANFVHGHWMLSENHPRKGRLRAISLYQNIYTRWNSFWEKRAFARAERVVAVSEQVREALIRHAGVSADVIEVIEPGVDTVQFRPLQPGEQNALRSELALGPEKFVLLFVGDIRSSRKNLDLALESLNLLGSLVHLAVIGDDSRSPYPTIAKEIGVAERTHFLGRRTDDLPDLMRGADAFAFPSHYDPFGLVVTEAMASGLPVITAPTVGASSLIRHGENGFVLPDSNDIGAFVGVVNGLRNDRARRADVGSAARVSAERHTWAAMAEKYIDLYKRIINERQANKDEAGSIPRFARSNL